jgi:hypothetical protein
VWLAPPLIISTTVSSSPSLPLCCERAVCALRVDAEGGDRSAVLMDDDEEDSEEDEPSDDDDDNLINRGSGTTCSVSFEDM